MDYLERYEAGEHEAVWAELRALGGAVLDDELPGEARRVADATMLRALSNLKRIEAGLRAAGYAFVEAAPPPPDAGAVIAAALGSGEESVRTMGLPPAMVARFMAAARQALGGMVMPPALAPSSAPARETALGDPARYVVQLDDFERIAGPAPLALASFWRIVGWCDFSGRWPGSMQVAMSAPALLVMPPATIADDYEAFVDDNGDDDGFTVELLVDPRDIDEARWPLVEVGMARGVDVRLPDGEWFVDFLRRMTRAAALPGIAPGAVPALDAIATAWEPF